MLIRYFLLVVFCITGSKLFAQEREPNAYLIFDLNVDSAYVQFGLNNPSVIKVASNDTIHVKNGFYHLTLSYPTSEDYYTTQNVLRGSANTITHDFDLSNNNINLRKPNVAIKTILNGDALVLTDSDTEIYLNEQYVDKNLAILKLPGFENRLSFRNPNFHTYSRAVFESGELQVLEHYFRSKKRTGFLPTFVPGLYQLRSKSYLKSGLIIAGITTSLSFGIKYQSEYQNKKTEFNVIRNLYLNETNEIAARELGIQMQEEASALSDENARRYAAFWALVAVLVYDYADKAIAYRKLPKKKRVNFAVELEPYFNKYIQLGAKISL